MEDKDIDQLKKRTQGDYINLGHSLMENHLKTEVKKSKGKTEPRKITDLLTKRIWAWFYYYVVNRFGPNHRYRAYTGSHNGIYNILAEPGETVSIAIAADWATDTPESHEVAEKMKEHDPHYTIHLGDTYYVGAPHEVKLNFVRHDSPWVRGSKGSFAVLGNHEMYARGDAFFKHLLPTLGLRNETGQYTGQHAGFFCLENDHWRILGLDTGYHSIGKVPVLELLPGLGPDCHFDDKLVDWLKKTVRLGDPDNKKGLLILTHHQYITAFKTEGEFTRPARQLAALIGTKRPVVWLWGHEHKFSMFERISVKDGITAFGRCIGHGGMPVELDAKYFTQNSKTSGYGKLVMVDQRQRPGEDTCRLGHNGYAVVSLQADKLEISYYDTSSRLLTETWLADINTGGINGSISATTSGQLSPEPGKTWTDAVKNDPFQ